MNPYTLSAVLSAVLRHDLYAFLRKTFEEVTPGTPFQPNWHLELIADRLQQCALGHIRRVIITVPPRSLKSIAASVAFPAWMLGQDATRKIICASYSSDLAAKFARDCRAVMESAWYRRLFPHTRLERYAEMDLMTTQKGMRYATSVGGTLTGLGGSVIIIDDPLKPQEAPSKVQRDRVKHWYDNTLFSRLDNKADDTIILVMQRLHMDDLVAHVLTQGSWDHLDLPAIAERDEIFTLRDGQQMTRKIGEVLHPAREPKAVLDTIQATMGSANFSAQYQQQPVPEAGNLVKRKWFGCYEPSALLRQGGFMVQSWDMAAKSSELSDFSVCTTWWVQDKRYYLLHVFRQRLTFPDLKRAVIEQARQFQPRSLLIEDTAAGTALIQEFRQRSQAGVPPPIAIVPVGDKIMRLAAQSPLLEVGQVVLPRQAPWLEAFLTELLAFPSSTYDDQVDSLSQFLTWMSERWRNRIRYGRTIGMY